MKLFKKSRTPPKVIVADAAVSEERATSTRNPKVPVPLSSPPQSLGCGSFGSSSNSSSISFVPSPRRKKNLVDSMDTPPTTGSSSSSLLTTLIKTSSERLPPVFTRGLSSFLRVADLEMDETLSLQSKGSTMSDDEGNAGSLPNFHCVAVNPPPGIPEDPRERWIALDDGAGQHAPIAPLAVTALWQYALRTTRNPHMWTPDAKTSKALSQPQQPQWYANTWEGGAAQDETVEQQDQVLVWTGSFLHNHYGSDLPAVRAAGIVNMAPRELMELLVDSSRVQEYNKLSLGRTDLLVLQEYMDPNGAFGGICKVIRSSSRPPLVRKTLQFVSVLIAKELDGGYLLVTRAVTPPDHQESNGVLVSEILMGVNWIQKTKDPNQCVLVSVNHIRSPMVPMMIAKRIGLQAAVNFIHDLRGCCPQPS